MTTFRLTSPTNFAPETPVFTMKILSTFIWPIRIWQLFALTPLSVSAKTAWPKKNLFLKFIACIWLIVYLVLFVVSMYFNKSYIDWEQKQFAVYHDIFSAGVIHVLLCIVVGESIEKIQLQIELMERLNRIDYAIQYKTQIKIDYKQYQQQNTHGSCAWIGWHLFCCTTTALYYYCMNDQSNLLGWLIYALPLFVYSLHYQRIVLFVHQLGARFRVLNQYLLDNFSTSVADGSDLSLILGIKGYREVEWNQQQFDSNESRAKLLEMRNVYQQLAEACDTVNALFGHSLPACIAVDFHKVMSNIYWLFVVWLNHHGWGAAIAPALWLSLNISHLFALTYMCQKTTKEVSFSSLHFEKHFSV